MAARGHPFAFKGAGCRRRVPPRVESALQRALDPKRPTTSSYHDGNPAGSATTIPKLRCRDAERDDKSRMLRVTICPSVQHRAGPSR